MKASMLNAYLLVVALPRDSDRRVQGTSFLPSSRR